MISLGRLMPSGDGEAFRVLRTSRGTPVMLPLALEDTRTVFLSSKIAPKEFTFRGFSMGRTCVFARELRLRFLHQLDYRTRRP